MSSLNATVEIGSLVGGKYKILEVLGQGGMGTVYKVLQIFLNSEMALKLLDSTMAADSAQVARFQQEAKTASALHHPNVIAILDFGLLDSEQPYLVMEFANGITLADYLTQRGPIPLESASKLFSQICLGVAAAHSQQVIHRDIKPKNIILLPGAIEGHEGSVKIIDFGIAKIATESGETQAVTQAQNAIGSPPYMSPEQCSGARVDKRTDIYSLGCVLFEILTGTPPYIGENSLKTMMMHQSARIPTLREASLKKAFPEPVEKVVAKMLAKLAADRYADVESAAKDFAIAATGSDSIIATGLEVQKRRDLIVANAPDPTYTAIQLAGTLSFSSLVSALMTVAIIWFFVYTEKKSTQLQEDLASSPEMMRLRRTVRDVQQLTDLTGDSELKRKGAQIANGIDALSPEGSGGATGAGTGDGAGGAANPASAQSSQQKSADGKLDVNHVASADPVVTAGNPDLKSASSARLELESSATSKQTTGAPVKLPKAQIKSKDVVVNGALQRQMIFPDMEMGEIKNILFDEWRKVKFDRRIARNTVLLPIGAPASIAFDMYRDDVPNIGEAYQLIGPDEFYGLDFTGNLSSILHDSDAPDGAADHPAIFTRLLKIVQPWRHLEVLRFNQINFTTEDVELINRLSHLRAVAFSQVSIDPRSVNRLEFFKRIQFADIDDMEPKFVIQGLQNAKNLEQISFTRTEVTGHDIDVLGHCPKLNLLELRQVLVTDLVAQAVARLNCDVLVLHDASVNPDQLKTILTSKRLKHIVVTKETYRMARRNEIRDERLTRS